MKTLETIYKKLNSVEKTELETHKVELASILDDFKRLSKFALNFSNKASNAAQSAAKEIDGLINDGISNISKSENLFYDIESKYKELGAKMPNELRNLKEDSDIELKYLLKLRKNVSNLRD